MAGKPKRDRAAYMRRYRAAKRVAREPASRTAEPTEPDLAPSAWAARHVRLVGEGRGWSQPKHLRDLADVLGRTAPASS